MIRIPDVKRYKIKLSDFAVGLDSSVDPKLSPRFAEAAFNFVGCDGALKDGEGVKDYAFGEGSCLLSGASPVKLYFYKRYDADEGARDDRLLVYASDGYVYEKTLSGAFTKISDLHFSAAPEGVSYKYNGNDVFLFSYGDKLYVYDGSAVSGYDAPSITSMCVYNERLFVTTGGESTSLWFSENFDPTNWYVSSTEAGFIDFQDGLGKLVKVVEFDGYAYVFRSFGITRVYAPAEQSEFCAVNLKTDRVRTIGGIVNCGKRIVYLTENGFYSFNGLSSERILKKADGFIRGVDNDNVVAAFVRGRYYAAITARIAEKLERVVVCYDVNRGDFYFIKGVPVTDLSEVSDYNSVDLCAIVENENGIFAFAPDAIFKKPLKKIWRSAFTDFGIDGRKTLSRITLYTANDVRIAVRSDDGERSFVLRGGKGLRQETIGLCGENFSVSIISELPRADVSCVTLEFTKAGKER